MFQLHGTEGFRREIEGAPDHHADVMRGSQRDSDRSDQPSDGFRAFTTTPVAT